MRLSGAVLQVDDGDAVTAQKQGAHYWIDVGNSRAKSSLSLMLTEAQFKRLIESMVEALRDRKSA